MLKVGKKFKKSLFFFTMYLLCNEKCSTFRFPFFFYPHKAKYILLGNIYFICRKHDAALWRYVRIMVAEKKNR